MPWDKSKNLVQIQVSMDFRAELEELAKIDRRSLASECLWLIEQGIERRLGMIERADKEDETKTKGKKEA